MADLFGKIRKIEDDLRPNVKDIEKEDKVIVEAKPEPQPQAVEPQVDYSLNPEERNELDADERAAFDDKGVSSNQIENQEPQPVNWEEKGRNQKVELRSVNNQIPDIENDFNKSKALLQGATNNNARFGGAHPWHTALAKIETVDDRQNLRNGKEMLFASAIMFGMNSDLFGLSFEDYLAEIAYTRGAQGFAAKLEKSNYSNTTVDKNVKTSRTQGGRDIPAGLQPSFNPYG